MPLPPDLYDKDSGYRIRICMLVVDNPLMGLVTGSKIHVCDGCGQPVWVNEDQVIPDIPDEFKKPEVVVKDLAICVSCMREAEKQDPNPEPEGPIFLRESDKLAWDAMVADEEQS